MSSEQFIEIQKCIKEFPKSKILKSYGNNYGRYKLYLSGTKHSRTDHLMIDQESIIMGDGGEATVFFATGKYSFSSHNFAFVSKDERVKNRYLFRIIEFILPEINYAGFVGSGLKNIDKFYLEKIKIKLISTKEQNKIESILASIDNVIEKTQLQISKLQDLKKGMINKFLTKGIDHKEFKDSELGMIPRSWKLIPLSQIANKKDPFSFAGGPFGSNLKTEHYCDSGDRIIQLQNIGDGEFLDDYEIFTSKEKANELLSCNIFPDDIIISKMGDPVARACIIPNLETRYLMASDGIRLSVNKNEFDVNFILETINHHRFRSEAERISIGSTRKRISLTELRTLIIAHPSLKEQKEISSFIHSMNLSIKKKKQKLFKVQCLKKSLMQDLLTEKVRVP